MNAAERREIVVGAVAAIVLAIGLLAVAITNRAALKTDDGLYHLSADFNRADGVSVGTPVRMAGIDGFTVAAARFVNHDLRGIDPRDAAGGSSLHQQLDEVALVRFHARARIAAASRATSSSAGCVVSSPA